MAQWFVDSASITNLIVTRSYIGSGSTSFNKNQSVLYINNGLRQGINNGNFLTTAGTSNHIQGFNNSSIVVSHVEGYNNSLGQGGNGSHVEGKNNFFTGHYSHIEGEYNTQTSGISTPFSFISNHSEGGYNTASMSNGCHVEGYNNKNSSNPSSYFHIEGINNNAGSIQQSFSHHIEGGNHTLSGVFYRTNHVEGAEHIYISGNGCHLSGRKNTLSTATSNPSHLGNHVEGYNNILFSQNAASTGIHICGISSSIYSSSQAHFMSGLSLQSHYISTAFTVGQFNSSNLSAYSNISSTGNTIRDVFTVGGGLNNSTRKNIFEISLITSASSIVTNPTRSIILPWVSESGNFADDIAAAAGGVPLGGFYRTGNNLKIRLS